MLSCSEVTTLAAADGVGGGPLMTRIGFRLHLLMCRHCRGYVRQINRIGAAARALFRQTPDGGGNEMLLRRVLQAMRENPNGPS
jgi:hypothetical protein